MSNANLIYRFKLEYICLLSLKIKYNFVHTRNEMKFWILNYTINTVNFLIELFTKDEMQLFKIHHA